MMSSHMYIKLYVYIVYNVQHVHAYTLPDLVIVILRGTLGIELQIQMPSPGKGHSFFKLVIVPHRMYGLYSAPTGPGSWDMHLLLTLVPYTAHLRNENTIQIIS